MLLPVLAAREASLDASTDERGPVMDHLALQEPSPEENASAEEHRSRARGAIGAAMAQLSAREQLIVRERLMAEEPRTLQELGERLGVSKERVRQIEERVRDKLRVQLEDMRDQAAA
jgi:RNA polymerase sigma-32 factor